MTVTVEVSNHLEIEKLFSFFKTIQVDNIRVVSSKPVLNPKIIRGNKDLNPKDLFGIWQNSPKNIDEIRTNAWQRKI